MVEDEAIVTEEASAGRQSEGETPGEPTDLVVHLPAGSNGQATVTFHGESFDLPPLIEALLFVADGPVETNQLAKALQVASEAIYRAYNNWTNSIRIAIVVYGYRSIMVNSNW